MIIFPKTKRAQKRNGRKNGGAFRTGVVAEQLPHRNRPNLWIRKGHIVLPAETALSEEFPYRYFCPEPVLAIESFVHKTGSKRIVFLPWRQKRPQRRVEREHPLLHQPVEGDRREHFRVARNFEKRLESELCAWLR